MQYLSIFFLGMILSFLGQLPLGTINMTAIQIAVQEHFRKAWKFSMGIALVEMVYLRLILSGMQWIIQNRLLFSIFNWLTILFFGVLGVLGFISAQKQSPDQKALLLNNRTGPVLTGYEHECPEPGTDTILGYLVRIFPEPGISETRIHVFQYLYTGYGAGYPVWIDCLPVWRQLAGDKNENQ